MPGCQKCIKQLTSQLTQNEYYFKFCVYVFKTTSVLFQITLSLLPT